MALSSLRGIRTIEDFELNDKVVFLRLDLNVPLDGQKISDETRIQAALPTLRYAIEQGAKLVIGSHMGRPKTDEDRKTLSLLPVADRLRELLDVEVILVEDPNSEAPKGLIPGMRKNQVLLLENLRFFPGETKNQPEMALTIAEYIDIYINDAFGASHRAHTSIVALPEQVQEKGIGFLIQKEVTMLEKMVAKPESPYVAVLGGSKVSDKIGVIENLIERVDAFIIGGAMAYTFLSAMGRSVGSSRVEKEKLNFTRDLIKRLEAREKTVLLPQDHLVVDQIDGGEQRITSSSSIDDGWMGVDIGPETISQYSTCLKEAKTIFWNGPMGIFERPEYAKGTFSVAEVIANNSGTTVVGGGDSAAAAHAAGVADKMTHISTGGGASLEFLQGDILPGLEVLRKKKRSEDA